MKTLILFLFSLSALANYIPTNQAEQESKTVYVEKGECEKISNGECLSLPRGYNFKTHDFTRGEFKLNQAKKAAYEAELLQKESARALILEAKKRINSKDCSAIQDELLKDLCMAGKGE